MTSPCGPALATSLNSLAGHTPSEEIGSSLGTTISCLVADLLYAGLKRLAKTDSTVAVHSNG